MRAQICARPASSAPLVAGSARAPGQVILSTCWLRNSARPARKPLAAVGRTEPFRLPELVSEFARPIGISHLVG